MLCRRENMTSAAAAERAGPASLAQAIRQGRSGWRLSTFGGGRVEVNWPYTYLEETSAREATETSGKEKPPGGARPAP
jgi:hypothetical protein